MAEARQRGMGRGLEAILPRSGKVEDGLREIPPELIQPNARQPRRTFDQARLAELAESIRTRGVLQPIVVRPLAGGCFELVAGERRLRAAQMVKLETIPALVRDTDDWERLDLALAENMARVDLNAVEEARACAMLVDDLGLTKGEVGRRVGRSRVAISNLVRLLDLPEEALELIERGELSEGHGRAILLCKDHAARRRLALDARDGGWSVREAERRAREAEGQPEPEPKRFSRDVHPDLAEALAAAEDTLSAAFGRAVRVRAKGDGCRVELDFETPGEAVELAERILARGAARAA
ncbi:MAG TPA: ParB/RepB/Spo0J family partition protein [Thermoleophilaceae bacterium]|nr:ParB/RepB/Spo0J family partition protein [Thermoleophilaceae bacterium]